MSEVRGREPICCVPPETLRGPPPSPSLPSHPDLCGRTWFHVKLSGPPRTTSAPARKVRRPPASPRRRCSLSLLTPDPQAARGRCSGSPRLAPVIRRAGRLLPSASPPLLGPESRASPPGRTTTRSHLPGPSGPRAQLRAPSGSPGSSKNTRYLARPERARPTRPSEAHRGPAPPPGSRKLFHVKRAPVNPSRPTTPHPRHWYGLVFGRGLRLRQAQAPIDPRASSPAADIPCATVRAQTTRSHRPGRRLHAVAVADQAGSCRRRPRLFHVKHPRQRRAAGRGSPSGSRGRRHRRLLDPRR